MKRLQDNINSRYIEASNVFLSGKRERIVAYVESYEDIAFWRLLLEEFETEKRYFQIMLPSRDNLTKGKKSAIRSCLQECALGKNMIACVDSDYDYLMQGTSDFSRQIITNPYILQTYTYAIENYKCYADSLHNICVQCTLNDRRIIDFNLFFKNYSEAIYPLFVWNVWFYRNKMHNIYSMQDFCRDIKIRTINLNEPDSITRVLSDRVKARVAVLEKTYPDGMAEVEKLKEEFRGLGLRTDNTYLFIRGHFLFETIIAKVLTPVCSSLIAEREQEIYKYAAHTEQLNNEISAYRHSQMSLQDAIRKSTHYRDCELYSRMRSDVQHLLVLIDSGQLPVLPECGCEEN
ncbi:MAG: DUF4435 domain-containing protein [Bacteroidaceae bacterium]|nr:DUF4435 domain-containing protein [Bacteroidaceae bacterium]